MSVLIKDEKLLGKHNEIWKEVSNLIKQKTDSKPVYNEKYLKTKTKSYIGKINTNFHNNKKLKEGSQCISLSVVQIESVNRKDKDYYPQVFLEECKFVIKEKRWLSLLLTKLNSLIIFS